MRRIIWTVTVGLFLGAMSLTSKAATPTFTHLYVFGDSYCDVGNDFIASEGNVPAPPYINGRFSNGPIWVDHVAGFLGLGTLKPYLAGGTDYAFGGAEVTAPVTTPYGSIPSVPQQVALYLQSTGGKADPNALYIIEGGGNDILNAVSDKPQQLGFEIALGISASELLLRHAGARYFLIPNLYNVGLLPAAAAAGNAAFATAATNATNKSLANQLALESLLEGIHIVRLDAFSLINAVVKDTSHFGFTDVVAPCTNLPLGSPVTECGDPDHTFFWDVEHPTEFGHAFFAVTVENAYASGAW